MFAYYGLGVLAVQQPHAFGHRYGWYGAAMYNGVRQAMLYELARYYGPGAIMHKHYTLFIYQFQAVLHTVVAGIASCHYRYVDTAKVRPQYGMCAAHLVGRQYEYQVYARHCLGKSPHRIAQHRHAM